MKTPAGALQLILFTNEKQTPENFLKDALAHHPGYRPGNVIPLTRELHQTREASPDRQYVVLIAKHIILIDETSAAVSEYVLLVEIAELTDVEQESVAYLSSLV